PNPENNRLPSSLRTRQRAPPGRVRGSLPASRSQILIDLPLAEYRRLPSSARARLEEYQILPGSVRSACPVSTSHTWIVSPPPEKSRLPSLLRARFVPPLPRRLRTAWPKSKSQTMMAPLRSAENRRLPSLLRHKLSVPPCPSPYSLSISLPFSRSHTLMA